MPTEQATVADYHEKLAKAQADIDNAMGAGGW